MATELERRGADLSDRLWSAKVLLQSPQLIEDVHYDYFLAGADIALSASYQATFAGFSACGLTQDDAHRLLLESVRLARTARERFAEHDSDGTRPAALVGASIGPYGAHRHDGSEYRGDYGVSAQRIRDFHRRQLEVLALSRADFIAFETVPSLAEGEAIVRLLEEFPELHAWLSFSCRDERHVCHGERFADCAALANEHSGIIATGINCSPPEFVESLLAQARGITTKTLLAYPNSGETWRTAGARATAVSRWPASPGAGSMPAPRCSAVAAAPRHRIFANSRRRCERPEPEPPQALCGLWRSAPAPLRVP